MTHTHIVRIKELMHDERSRICEEYSMAKPLPNLRAEKEQKVFEEETLRWTGQLVKRSIMRTISEGHHRD